MAVLSNFFSAFSTFTGTSTLFLPLMRVTLSFSRLRRDFPAFSSFPFTQEVG
jgi:hypothetical protein